MSAFPAQDKNLERDHAVDLLRSAAQTLTQQADRLRERKKIKKIMRASAGQPKSVGRPTAMETPADAVQLIEDAKRALVKTNDICVARDGAFAALNEAQRVLRALD